MINEVQLLNRFTMKTTFLIKTAILTLSLILSLSSSSIAQTKVTFKVNLKPQLEDSVYIPDNDRIYLKGNVFPLSNSKKIYLEDTTPADSIYEATVDFPPSANGQTLRYNYYIYRPDPDKTLKEQMPRQIKLRKEKIELDAMYFDAFAW